MMSDEEFARLRAQAAGFLADALDAGVPTLTRERTQAFALLFQELDRARKVNAYNLEAFADMTRQRDAAWREVEQLRAIVQAVATTDVIAHEGDAGDYYSCPFCNGDTYITDEAGQWVRSPAHPIDGMFTHGPDCPVLKARALLNEPDLGK